MATAEADAPSTADNEEVMVTTNFWDLPPEEVEGMKEVLHTENLTQLGARSLKSLRDYFEQRPMSGQSPFGPGLETNYFYYVSLALPYFVSPLEKHNGYHREAYNPAREERLLAYALYRLDRSPKNIQRLYDYAKPLLPTLLSKEQYYRLELKWKVPSLIETYKALDGKPEHWEELAKFYRETFNEKGQVNLENPKVKELYGDGAYGFTAYDLGAMISKRIPLEGPRFVPNHMDLSFWMRRQHEGNEKVVFSILQEIDEIYRDKSL